jgi:hypothetical protein
MYVWVRYVRYGSVQSMHEKFVASAASRSIYDSVAPHVDPIIRIRIDRSQTPSKTFAVRIGAVHKTTPFACCDQIILVQPKAPRRGKEERRQERRPGTIVANHLSCGSFSV